MSDYHVPVMLSECLEGLDLKPDGVYVDVTFGGGGHSKAILDRLGEDGLLIAFDQDVDAQKNLITDSRLIFLDQNFRSLKKVLRLNNIDKVDGILADLGISSYQIDNRSRGFSFMGGVDLDMRMDQTSELDAVKVLNTYSEKNLVRIFSEYGEVRNSKTLAAKIVAERENEPIATVSELVSILESMTFGKPNRYFAQVFQAIRIEVNDEIGALEEMLDATVEVLDSGGRLVVMSYHSLEDRIVKRLMKTGNTAGEVIKDFYGVIERPFKILTKKAIEAQKEELELNTRARSAKLRIAEKR